MAATRSIVADLHQHLSEHLPDRRVEVRPRPLDVLDQPLVHLWLVEVEATADLPIVTRRHTVHAWVVIPGDFAEQVDVDLEELLDEVLDALDVYDTGSWTEAVRAVYPPGDPSARTPAYRISLTSEV